MCALWTGCLCSALHHGWWIVAAVAFLIAVKSTFPKFPAIRLAVGMLSGMAVTVFIELFNNSGERMSLDWPI
jgi:hypothetical protein